MRQFHEVKPFRLVFTSIHHNYPKFRRWRTRGIISMKKSMSLRVWKKIVEFSSLLSSLIVHSDVNNATRGYYFLAESNILLLLYLDRSRCSATNIIHILSFYVWINVDGLNSRIALELCCQIMRLCLMKGEEKIEDVCMREVCVCAQTNIWLAWKLASFRYFELRENWVLGYEWKIQVNNK